MTRYVLLVILFFAGYAALGTRLYSIQVKQGDYYFERAQARGEYLRDTEVRRGKIYVTDRYDTEIPIALVRDYPMVYAVPKEVENPAYVAKTLNLVTGAQEDVLMKALENKNSLFRLVKEKASAEEVAKLNALGLKGVYIGSRESRLYPFEKLFSRVLGFVGMNESANLPVGLYGVEKYYEEELSRGDDVKLTLDRNIQAQSEVILRSLLEKHDAESGTILVTDPATGAIVALASMPDYDPNAYGEYPIENFVNPAVTHMYEAGSVFKPITMAAGIDSGAITPDTTFIDKGYVTLNSRTIRNWDLASHGTVTMTNVIEQSINTGTVFAEQKIGHNRFLSYVKRFGFGAETKIDLPEESKGSIRNLEKKDTKDVDYATASFGQGTAITPIQLASAFGAIANGGLLMQPFTNADGKPVVVRRVINESTSRAVVTMMESAVDKARLAAIPGYRIAGKTGTAQVPDFVHGGYSEQYIHTYVGFGPVTSPKFLILIKLDKPNKTLAGATVVPAFKELAEYVISYYRIPPDNASTELVP